MIVSFKSDPICNRQDEKGRRRRSQSECLQGETEIDHSHYNTEHKAKDETVSKTTDALIQEMQHGLIKLYEHSQMPRYLFHRSEAHSDRLDHAHLLVETLEPPHPR